MIVSACARRVNRPTEQTNFVTFKFILGTEACGNKTKEMYYSLLSLEIISVVLFP